MESTGIPELVLGRHTASVPIIQGGMGVGISLAGLATAVAKQGAIGVISTAGIGRQEPDYRNNLKRADSIALTKEIRKARSSTDGILGVNIMMAISNYEDILRVVVEEGIDVVFIGAGLPLRNPSSIPLKTLRESSTSFLPKISSARAASVILKSWDRNYASVPDGIVVEGPLAGGHLGFSRADLDNGKITLENILKEVLKTVEPYEQKYGRSIPIIAAGGIYTGEDIQKVLSIGAKGVKMGTRFVATYECDAHENFKQAYIECKEDNLVIIDSPVGLPGRAINSDLLREVEKGIRKPYECPWKCLRTCDFLKAPYCIAKALMNAKEGDMINGFAFAGANAFRIDRLMSVKRLISLLVEEFIEACSMHLDYDSAMFRINK